MKLLFVSSQAMFKDTRFGGAKRLYYLAKELESKVELSVICLDGCQEIDDSGSYPTEFTRQLFIPQERKLPARKKIPFLSNVSKSLKDNRQAIDAFVGNTRFDATFLAYAGSLSFLDGNLIPFPGKTVYAEDDLLIELLRIRLQAASNPISRFVQFFRYYQSKKFYKRTLKKVSDFVCISSQEKHIVQSLWPHLKTTVMGYGIPVEKYPLLKNSKLQNVLGFIGNYRHIPNLDAVRWLVQDLFPFVLTQIPEARLVLCGTAFPEDVREACRGNDSILILDAVEDLATFYNSISVFVNSIREGRGLRTKVVEAAAYGRPIVSTKLGAEGLDDLELGLFETKEGLVEALRALSSPDNYARVTAHNRATVERLFSMKEVGRQLTSVLSP